MNKFLILGLLATAALAVPAPDAALTQQNRDLDCLEDENTIFSCVTVKTVNTLNRAARSSDIQLIDGVTFVRDAPMERSGKSLKTETEMMNELPRDASDRTIKLVSMLYESAMSFVKTHSLKLSMPDGSVSRALAEGRGKIKKMILPLIAAAAVKIFALVPILLGGLGLVALKALLVGKVALLIAGIMAFQKLFGSSSGSSAGSIFGKNPQSAGGWLEPAGQAWAAGAGNVQPQGYYRRSFDGATSKDAQTLAYSAHAPTSNETA